MHPVLVFESLEMYDDPTPGKRKWKNLKAPNDHDITPMMSTRSTSDHNCKRATTGKHRGSSDRHTVPVQHPGKQERCGILLFCCSACFLPHPASTVVSFPTLRMLAYQHGSAAVASDSGVCRTAARLWLIGCWFRCIQHTNECCTKRSAHTSNVFHVTLRKIVIFCSIADGKGWFWWWKWRLASLYSRPTVALFHSPSMVHWVWSALSGRRLRGLLTQ